DAGPGTIAAKPGIASADAPVDTIADADVATLDTEVVTESGATTTLGEALAQLRELQQNSPMLFTDVNADAIAQVVSDWTGVPLGKMRRESASAILNLSDEIKSRIKGQDHAVEQIASAL